MRIRKTDQYERWFRQLRDRQAQSRINMRIRRIERASELVGDCKPVGGQVTELRFAFGPGYRVYVSRQGNELLLLLAGGDKSSQERDIRQAQELARQWSDDDPEND